MNRKTAREFWTIRKEYPAFGSKQRRIYELVWLLPKLEAESLLDIGCGSGEFLDLLLRTSDIKEFYGCDISQNLLAKVDPRVKTFVYDIYKGGQLPEVDAVLLWGCLQYIFEDGVIERLLSDLKCKKLFVRTSCSKEDFSINKYSNELGDTYSSRYMTLDNLIKLLGQEFTVIDVTRAYPDAIESKFGSKQWLIECIKED